MSQEELKKRIGIRIKSFRKDLKITQLDFAEMVQLDDRNFRRIESGDGNPTIETLFKISESLNISVQDLILPADELQVVKKYRSVVSNTPPDISPEINWTKNKPTKKSEEPLSKKTHDHK